MATKWKCPKNDCSPTDLNPLAVPVFGDDMPISVCALCSAEYPTASFKRVSA
jgi:hypothetical protein